MSAAEFEIYLAVLGRTLGLSAHERRELVAEIKDHFDERLSELLDAGVERQRAVRMVLDDFGEAAELAARFSEIAERRNQRRWMMRAATGTFATAAVFMAGLFFIGGAPAPTPTVAQTTDAAAKPATPPSVAGEFKNPVVETTNPTPAANPPRIQTLPMIEVIATLARAAELEVVIDPQAIDAVDGASGRMGSLGIRADKISPKAAQQALTVLIDSLGPEIDFDVLDGVLVVAHPGVLTTTKVYKLPVPIEKSVDSEQVLIALEQVLEAHEEPVVATPVGESLVLTLGPRGHRRIGALLKAMELAVNPPAQAATNSAGVTLPWPKPASPGVDPLVGGPTATNAIGRYPLAADYGPGTAAAIPATGPVPVSADYGPGAAPAIPATIPAPAAPLSPPVLPAPDVQPLPAAPQAPAVAPDQVLPPPTAPTEPELQRS